MPTAREIVYNIRNTANGGRSNRDVGFTDRQLLFAFRVCRNAMIPALYWDQYGKKRDEINPQWAQDLGVIPLTEVDMADSPIVTWGEVVKKVVIPKTLDLPQNAGLVFFGRTDKQTHIQIPDVAQGSYDKFRQYRPKDDIYGAQMGDVMYLYGENVDRLCYVNIRIIADDPTKVNYYDTSGSPTCFDWDTTPYPVPTGIEQQIYEMVWQKYILMGVQLPKDDADDEKKANAA